MGTDLEKTIEEMRWQLNYYIECCRPNNGEELKVELELLFDNMRENK